VLNILVIFSVQSIFERGNLHHNKNLKRDDNSPKNNGRSNRTYRIRTCEELASMFINCRSRNRRVNSHIAERLDLRPSKH